MAPTIPPTHKSHKGRIVFALVVFLIGAVLLIVAMNGNNKDQMNGTLTTSTSSQSAAVSNFYDCWEALSRSNPASTSTCTNNGKTYVKPSVFSSDAVRNLNKVPDTAQTAVLSYARQKFEHCEATAPTNVAVTSVKGANDRLVYLTSTCGALTTALLVGDSGWQEVILDQGVLSCNVADTYHVPKSVISDTSASKSPGTSSSCINADGTKRVLQD